MTLFFEVALTWYDRNVRIYGHYGAYALAAWRRTRQQTFYVYFHKYALIHYKTTRCRAFSRLPTQTLTLTIQWGGKP